MNYPHQVTIVILENIYICVAYADDIFLYSSSGMKSMLCYVTNTQRFLILCWTLLKATCWFYENADDIPPVTLDNEWIVLSAQEKHLGWYIGRNSNLKCVNAAVMLSGLNKLISNFITLMSNISCLNIWYVCV